MSPLTYEIRLTTIMYDFLPLLISHFFFSCKVKKGPTQKTERNLSQILSKNKNLIPQMKYK